MWVVTVTFAEVWVTSPTVTLVISNVGVMTGAPPPVEVMTMGVEVGVLVATTVFDTVKESVPLVPMLPAASYAFVYTV
jgi:hypothetical protein